MNSRWWLPYVKFNTAFSGILKVYFLKKDLPLTYFLHMEIEHFLSRKQGQKGVHHQSIHM